jgi:hypothetical protein
LAPQRAGRALLGGLFGAQRILIDNRGVVDMKDPVGGPLTIRACPKATQRVNPPDTDGVLTPHRIKSRRWTGRDDELWASRVQLERGDSDRTSNRETRNGALT